MPEKITNYRKILENIILYTFLFGPVIDILTFFSSNSLLITPGIIIRSAFILVAIFYLIFIDKPRRLLNIILLSIVLLLSIGISINNLNLIQNLNFQFFNYAFKFIYLCISLIYFSSWAQSQKSFDTHLFRIPFLIIIISFILAIITHTSQLTYDTWGDGSSGWFSSPNELGVLLCCIFPFSLYNAFKNSPSQKPASKILDIIIFIALSAIMLTIGTKAPLIGFFFISTIYFIYRLFTIKTNLFQPTLLIIPFLLVVASLLWNHLPAVTNTNLRLDRTQDISLRIDVASLDSTSIILNGRDDFETTINNYRKNDTAANQIALNLFGKFYVDDSDNLPIIERDFHDIFYLYGLLSLIFIIALLAPSILAAILHFIYTLKNHGNHFSFITLTSVGITIIAAFVSGHTLLSPSVTSFFVISFALLLKNPQPEKRTVAFIASAGGHLTQIMQLAPIFENYYSYLITEKTPIKLNPSIPVKYVAYCSRKQRLSYPFKAFYNIIRAFILFSIINPDTIVTTGTHTAVPFCIDGYLFRRKVIYIESFAKNSSPTLTGRTIYPFADTFIVQWKKMKKFYPKAKFFGGIY